MTFYLLVLQNTRALSTRPKSSPVTSLEARLGREQSREFSHRIPGCVAHGTPGLMKEEIRARFITQSTVYDSVVIVSRSPNAPPHTLYITFASER